jgi:hypothetical protein
MDVYVNLCGGEEMGADIDADIDDMIYGSEDTLPSDR